LEIAYELRHGGDYALLSQKDVPLNGWPYDLFLGHLDGPGNVTGKTAAMIDSYINWGKGGNSLYSLTLALIDLDRMDELASSLDAYASEAALMTGFFNPEFIAARMATERYDGNAQYDLVHLLDNMDDKTECKSLGMLSAGVRDAVDACIVHENHWTNLLDEPAENAHGLSVWFPDRATTADYHNTGIAEDTAWPDFLDEMGSYFQQHERMDSPLPAAVSPLDSDSDGLMDSIRIMHSGQDTGTMTDIEIYGPDGELFHEETYGAGPESSMDISLGGLGYYEVAMYQRTSEGHLQNYSLAKNLPKEGLGVISGRVMSNAGRALAWVGVNLQDGGGNIVSQAFTDNYGYYRMEVVVPRDTNGTGLRLVCGLGSGQKNVTINTLEAQNSIDFSMEISSAYIPWAMRIAGVLNLAGLMALVYWAAWGRDKRIKDETENLIQQQPITPQ
ncbi:MAG: clostripain-related cysteine peptidase, partial [Thermoplasmata archaeon]